MSDTDKTTEKPDGAAFDDFFESLGKKAEDLSSQQQPATNGEPAQPGEEEQRVVDEVESLCMNCHENVAGLLHLSPFLFIL
jgi:zinc finger protein